MARRRSRCVGRVVRRVGPAEFGAPANQPAFGRRSQTRGGPGGRQSLGRCRFLTGAAQVEFRTALKVALAADTISIPVTGILDNAVMLVVPRTMEAAWPGPAAAE